jgi:hypothetical protein
VGEAPLLGVTPGVEFALGVPVARPRKKTSTMIAMSRSAPAAISPMSRPFDFFFSSRRSSCTSPVTMRCVGVSSLIFATSGLAASIGAGRVYLLYMH